MTNRRNLLAGLISLPFVSLASPARAHRELLTVTEMNWNKSTQTLDITHVFHIHHAEQALAHMGVLPNDDLRDMRNQARLAVYVEEHFALKDADDKALMINTIGAEAGVADVYVFQECRLDKAPAELWVKCDLMRPEIQNQINEVHLIKDKRVASMRLSGRQIQKKLIAK